MGKNNKIDFRPVGSMTEGEKQAFMQGCKTVENKIQVSLGMRMPPDDYKAYRAEKEKNSKKK